MFMACPEGGSSGPKSAADYLTPDALDPVGEPTPIPTTKPSTAVAPGPNQIGIYAISITGMPAKYRNQPLVIAGDGLKGWTAGGDEWVDEDAVWTVRGDVSNTGAWVGVLNAVARSRGWDGAPNSDKGAQMEKYPVLKMEGGTDPLLNGYCRDNTTDQFIWVWYAKDYPSISTNDNSSDIIDYSIIADDATGDRTSVSGDSNVVGVKLLAEDWYNMRGQSRAKIADVIKLEDRIVLDETAIEFTGGILKIRYNFTKFGPEYFEAYPEADPDFLDDYAMFYPWKWNNDWHKDPSAKYRRPPFDENEFAILSSEGTKVSADPDFANQIQKSNVSVKLPGDPRGKVFNIIGTSSPEGVTWTWRAELYQ